MSSPTIICLTPVKNEAWILDRFLKCTSLWADYIIVADQNSTDNSREIAQKYPKVTLIENPSATYNEQERQKILIEAARKIPVSGKRLLIALDADEFFVGHTESKEWDTILQAPVGTSLWFQWANVLPNMEKYYAPNFHLLFGYMDDGKEHQGNLIHSPRLPTDKLENRILFSQIKVLHYQYTDWERMKSKHRWYQCLERIKNPQRSAIDIYRQYHHMDVPVTDTNQMPSSWFGTYENAGIDMTSILREKNYWWDKEVLDFFDKYGIQTFAKEAIWDVDWNNQYQLCFQENPKIDLSDPRTRLEKWAHNWLQSTQVNPYTFKAKVINKWLKASGW
ncbi:MAG TPA: glycosyltransferase family 2 protein [Oculatellaceae cyanobacterium]|jgi:glycosyltransferase involved in cell wall biosynthesis